LFLLAAAAFWIVMVRYDGERARAAHRHHALRRRRRERMRDGTWRGRTATTDIPQSSDQGEQSGSAGERLEPAGTRTFSSKGILSSGAVAKVRRRRRARW
jgi:hypothetical protein